MSPKPVSGVVLRGGQSSRMGRDKAALTVAGEALLDRQLRLLAEAGCAERLVSVAAPPGPPPPAGPTQATGEMAGGEALRSSATGPHRWIEDRFREAGPLAGLERALARAHYDPVLVLAVDLPAMTAEFLRSLLAEAGPDCGVVPVIDGRFEPLVAVYPRLAHAEAEHRLQRHERALQDFVRAGVAAGWLRSRTVSAADQRLFTNWNRPEDLAAG
ncbi:MAG TPA: molybdenum cofactor guanylyltransferase [Candidatus Limnocylindria bacterium]|nr:molybdenum cofactor guanylyltransferase [Candidatus Limnocylindria bacterium]